MFQKIDAWIFREIERVAHWWQRLTGCTNFWLARGASVIGSALFIWAALEFLSQGSSGATSVIRAVCVYGLALISLHMPVSDSWLYRQAEEHYSEEHTLAHPLTLEWRIEWFAPRLLSVGIAILELVGLLTRSTIFLKFGSTYQLPFELAFLCLMMKLYLQMVIPLPPGMSKIRQWREALQVSRQLTPSPTSR